MGVPLTPLPRDSRVCARDGWLTMLAAPLETRPGQRAAPSAPVIRPHPVCVGSFIEAGSSAPSLATSVPNGIPGSGMCGNQTTGRQIYPGAYIKREKPGAAPPRQEPGGALPSSPPGEQARSTVSTATPSLEGTLLAGPLLQVREVVTKHLLSRP